MEKISVIVPIYNSEAFLEKCLNSIVSQTYPNIEIILVNDCSTDNSGLICKDYQAKHNNIVYIEMDSNRGVSHARNEGLKSAKGSLIGFVDSDDWIEKDMYESLFETLIAHNVPMVSANFKLVRHATQGGCELTPTHKEDLCMKDVLEAILYTISNRDVVLWNKLYRQEVFKGIVFPEGKIFEDIGAIHLLVENAQRMAVSTKYLYYYHLQPESITRSKKVSKKVFEHLDVVIERYDYLTNKYHSMELEQLCRQQIFTTLTHIVDKLNHINIMSDKHISEEFIEARKFVYEKFSYDNCGLADAQKKLLEALEKNVEHYEICRDILSL